MCSPVVAQEYQPAKLCPPLGQWNGRTGATRSKRTSQDAARDRRTCMPSSKNPRSNAPRSGCPYASASCPTATPDHQHSVPIKLRWHELTDHQPSMAKINLRWHRTTCGASGGCHPNTADISLRHRDRSTMEWSDCDAHPRIRAWTWTSTGWSGSPWPGWFRRTAGGFRALRAGWTRWPRLRWPRLRAGTLGAQGAGRTAGEGAAR